MRSLRWRRNRRFAVLFTAGFVVLTLSFGDARLTPFVSGTPATPEAAEEPPADIKSDIDLFDETMVHEISITFDKTAYDAMIRVFRQTGDKEFIEAALTIDGTTRTVGMRLKGNSTLRSLGGAGGRQAPVGNAVGGPAGGGGLGTTASIEQPEGLPWLISFDEYVKGQRYQGYEEIALRPITSTGSALNESLSLELVSIAGEPSQKWMYTSVSVNGGKTALRLAIEVPKGAFADENFAGDGVLYKALSTGHFSYLGEDPLAYEDAYKQVTKSKEQDLKPLIDLLRWVSQASDEEFAAGLAQHVDIESFARYLALQDFLQNFDDMGGPGQNYYLWYDIETKRFTVITWDLNLAFSGMGGFPGGGAGGGQQGRIPGAQAGGQAAPGDDAGGQGAPPGGNQGPAAGGRGPLGGNPLKERFLASAAFKGSYAAARAEVYGDIFGSGQATTQLSRIQALLSTRPDLMDTATVEAQASNLRTAVETKSAAVLATLQP